MGTRHLIIIYYKGEYVLAQYGQWDGYPEGEGVKILHFLKDTTNVTKLRQAFDKNMVYVPDQAEIDKANQNFHKKIVGDSTDIIPPSLSRDTSSKILDMIATTTDPIPVIKDLKSIEDWSECRWGYVIDLDRGLLEVYFLTPRSTRPTTTRPGSKRPASILEAWPLAQLPDAPAFVYELMKYFR